MEQKDESSRFGIASWAFRKLVHTPAVWLGLATGGSTGVAMASVSNMGAGIGFGAMIGVVTVAVTHAIATVTRNAYRNRTLSRDTAAESKSRELEQATLDKLKAVGLSEDAVTLERLIEKRNAIIQHCENSDIGAERSGSTLELASAIVKAALPRAAELIDLKQRLDDPILEKPTDVHLCISACQMDLTRAYRAVANARTHLLMQREISADEFLAESRPVTAGGLGHLAVQLEEETALMERVQKRLNSSSEPTEQHTRSLGGSEEEPRGRELE